MTTSSFLLKASLLSWAFPRAAWSSFLRVSGQLGARLIAERVGRRKKSWITRSFFLFLFFFCWQMDFCCLKVGKEFFVWTQSRQPCRWGKCFKATLHRFVNQLLRLSPSCLCEFRLHQLTSQGQSSSTLASFTTVTRSFPIGSIYFHGNSYSTGRKHTEKGKL